MLNRIKGLAEIHSKKLFVCCLLFKTFNSKVTDYATSALLHYYSATDPAAQLRGVWVSKLINVHAWTTCRPAKSRFPYGRFDHWKKGSATVAIIWQALSSDRSEGSDSKNTRMQCVRSPISRWHPLRVTRNHWLWHFLWTKFKNTSALVYNKFFHRI